MTKKRKENCKKSKNGKRIKYVINAFSMRLCCASVNCASELGKYRVICAFKLSWQFNLILKVF